MNPTDATLSARTTILGIMGTPMSSGNRGVYALGASLVRLCLEANPGGDVRFFDSHRDGRPILMRPNGAERSINIVHWRMSPRGGLKNHLFVIVGFSFLYRFLPFLAVRRWISSAIPWIREVEEATFVGDVRGGDSFSDIYGLKRLIHSTLPVLSVIWVKGGIVLFPQTYGPFKSGIAKWIARWTIRNACTVIARDTESQRLAQSLAHPSQSVLLSPDVAFALHSDPMIAAEIDGGIVPKAIPSDVIGLNVNGLMFNGGYTGKNMFGLKLDYRRFVVALARRLLSVHPGPLLLVPHTYAPAGHVESDNDACRQLKEALPAELQSRVSIVTGNYDAHQLKGIIARCDFFVGSRMHSCIAALSQGVPCVGVAYSMKFRGVFQTVGMADWIVDARYHTETEAVDAVLRLFARHSECRSALAVASAVARSQLAFIFSRLMKSATSSAKHQ